MYLFRRSPGGQPGTDLAFDFLSFVPILFISHPRIQRLLNALHKRRSSLSFFGGQPPPESPGLDTLGFEHRVEPLLVDPNADTRNLLCRDLSAFDRPVDRLRVKAKVPGHLRCLEKTSLYCHRSLLISCLFHHSGIRINQREGLVRGTNRYFLDLFVQPGRLKGHQSKRNLADSIPLYRFFSSFLTPSKYFRYERIYCLLSVPSFLRFL